VSWIYNTLAGIWSSIGSLRNSIASVAASVGNAVAGAVNAARSAAASAVSGAVNSVRDWVNTFYATMAWVGGKIQAAIGPVINRISSVAQAVAEGVANGIRDWVNRFYTTIAWVSGKIQAAVDVVKSWASGALYKLGESVLSAAGRLAREIFTALIGDALKDAQEFIEKLKPIIESVLYFFANPTRAIRDLIVGWLVTWACRALAHEIDPSIPLFDDRGGGAGGGGDYSGTAESPVKRGELAWPLDGLYICGNTFRNPPSHYGLDLALPSGKRVYAMHNGTAIVPDPMPAGYGNYIIVQNGEWRTLYAHGAKVIVSHGAKVKMGQQIMVGDSVGFSTGDHLHLEIIYNGQYLDPALVLGL
jgi:murein DD-endopeptidase MepM/ murein hydrolase activator NlpD